MRLFVAINLAASVRRRIYNALRELRAAPYPVRWAEPSNYHLTLKFLGTVDPRRIEGIREIQDRVVSGNRSFDLKISGVGAFPTIRRPSVVWVGVDPSPALRCLKQDLEWGLAECGLERETRAFHPHLTVGRANESEGAGVFRGLDRAAGSLRFTEKVRIESVELMRSHLAKSGARYEVLHSSALGRAGKRG